MQLSHSVYERSRILVPSPLAPGDLVAVVAPAGPPEMEELNTGLAFLERHGLEVFAGRHLNARHGYLAGTDEQRSRDLGEMLRDPRVRALWFARGGYGTMRLLDRIDLDDVRTDPKLLIGMSDITALQLSFFARSGLVTVSGPMPASQVASGLDEISESWLVKALTEPFAGRDLLPPPALSPRVLRHGHAEGFLLGGCLSLVSSLLGTPHCPDLQSAVLFLEDINESPYRFDRMLTQLKLAGSLDRVAAVVLGHCLGLNGTDLSEEVGGRVLELTEERGVPVVAGYPHGHVLPNLAIPHGVWVELSTDPLHLIVKA